MGAYADPPRLLAGERIQLCAYSRQDRRRHVAPFGESTGISEAAKRYFKKSPTNLNTREAALLSLSTTSTAIDPAHPSESLSSATADLLSRLGTGQDSEVKKSEDKKPEKPKSQRSKAKVERPAAAETAEAKPAE